MNIPTLIALIIILLLLIPAILYLKKNGTCGSCPDKGACHGHCDTKALKKAPGYKEKSEKIDEIIKKHGF